MAALPDADLVSVDADPVSLSDELGVVNPEDRARVSDLTPTGGTGTEMEQLAVTAVRLEMAAGYLRLIGGR